MSVKDVWKSTMTVSGELFVMTASTTSLQELHATVSASGENDICRLPLAAAVFCAVNQKGKLGSKKMF